MILESLIDAHVHLAFPSNSNIQENLLQYKLWGVGVVRDGGDAERKTLHISSNSHPHLLLTGEALRPNGYGAFIGKDRADWDSLLKAVDEWSDLGFNWVKIILTGVTDFSCFGLVSNVCWDMSLFYRLIDACHQRGLKVMVHANGPSGIQASIEAGADSIEHGYFIKADQLKILAAKQIAWVPTLAPVAVWISNPSFRRRLKPGQNKVIQQMVQDHVSAIKRAIDLGVVVLVGSDAGAPGIPHGRGCWLEILCWLEGGIPFSTALKCATSSPTEFFKIANHQFYRYQASEISWLYDYRATGFSGPLYQQWWENFPISVPKQLLL